MIKEENFFEWFTSISPKTRETFSCSCLSKLSILSTLQNYTSTKRWKIKQREENRNLSGSILTQKQAKFFAMWRNQTPASVLSTKFLPYCYRLLPLTWPPSVRVQVGDRFCVSLKRKKKKFSPKWWILARFEAPKGRRLPTSSLANTHTHNWHQIEFVDAVDQDVSVAHCIY